MVIGLALIFASEQPTFVVREQHKHAGAHEVTIRMFRKGDRVVITVADDGAGFEPSIVDQRVAEGHIGLASLQARFDAMGGAMTIDSGVGRGAVVTVTSPPEDFKLV